MAGLEAAAAVYGLITGTIGIIETSIKIYEAVRDKSGITKELRMVCAKLPSIKEILENAAEQFKSKGLDAQVWVNASADVEHCMSICQELQDVLERAYPGDETGPAGRVFKNLDNIVSRRGKKAEELLKEICHHLDILRQRQIITNTRLLEELKEAVNELFPKSSITQHNLYGTNVGGDQSYTNSGSGQMITGQGTTVNFNSKGA